MARVVIAAALVVVAIVVAWFLRRRRPAPPTTPEFHVPVQIDRTDFSRPDADWLVVVFTSSTCAACEGVAMRAAPLDTPEGPVTVQIAEVGLAPELHRRYGIDAVPMVLIADADGVVVRHFVGPVTATDLWAAMAEAREPGSTPGGCERHDH